MCEVGRSGYIILLITDKIRNRHLRTCKTVRAVDEKADQHRDRDADGGHIDLTQNCEGHSHHSFYRFKALKRFP